MNNNFNKNKSKTYKNCLTCFKGLTKLKYNYIINN